MPCPHHVHIMSRKFPFPIDCRAGQSASQINPGLLLMCRQSQALRSQLNSHQFLMSTMGGAGSAAAATGGGGGRPRPSGDSMAAFLMRSQPQVHPQTGGGGSGGVGGSAGGGSAAVASARLRRLRASEAAWAEVEDDGQAGVTDGFYDR